AHRRAGMLALRARGPARARNLACTVRKRGPLSDIRRRWVAPWSWSRPEPGRAAALRSAPREQTVAPSRRVAAPWISFGLRTAGQAGTAEIWPPPSQHHPEQEYSRG